MWQQPKFYKLLLLVVVLVGILIIAQEIPVFFPAGIPNYLGWHNLLEMTSIVVSLMVFAVGWNNKNIKTPSTTVFLACSFWLVGTFDLMHTLSYVGMPDFVTPNGVQKHLTFWLLARIICALALLMVAIRKWGPFIDYSILSKVFYVNTFVISAGFIFLGLFHTDLFPVWFVAGTGLTDAKKSLEYIVIALHVLASAFLLRRIAKGGDSHVNWMLLSASITLAVGEIFFTIYTNMVGGYNVLGHLYKVLGYLFIHRALVAQAFDDPYDELKDSNFRITQLVNYDSLTGLPNKQLFKERVTQAVKLSDRTEKSFAMFFLDLDNFKNVNDTLGHSSGDLLLKEVSIRLLSVVRDLDTVGRVGGDEFVLLIQNVDQYGASAVASDIISALTKPFKINGNSLMTSASIGIAIFWKDGENFETLYQHADTAMYVAKNEGKNNFAFFTQESQNKIEHSIQIESHLRQAIRNNELSLYYQPQVSLVTNKLVGAEALLRWRHPTLGNISPAEFIPIAEKTGLIIEIGEWVIKEAIQQIQVWENAKLDPGIISVNISVVQFNDSLLAEKILLEIAKCNVSAEKLGVELTESVAMNFGSNIFVIMDKLRSSNVKLSIDDFGTGYSSLSVLKKFNISKIKIDQSFVRDISHEDSDQAIVSAIIKMAKSLGFSTIAEGVETAEQAEILTKLGCDEMQGFFLSKPIPVPQFEEFVRTHNEQ